MNVRIIVHGDEELIRKFLNTPARMAQLRTALDLSTQVIHGAVVPATPVGVSSVLRGSWQTNVAVQGLSVLGIVGSPIPYAEVIEHGRRIGAPMPPPDALATWVARKLGPDVDPFVVARSIKAKGITGRHMLETSVTRTRPVWTTIIGATVGRLLERS